MHGVEANPSSPQRIPNDKLFRRLQSFRFDTCNSGSQGVVVQNKSWIEPHRMDGSTLCRGPVSGARTSDLHSLLAAAPSARLQIPWGGLLAAANESDVRSSLGSQGALLAGFRAGGGRGGFLRKSRVRKSRGPGSSLTKIESPFRSSSLSVAQTSTSC